MSTEVAATLRALATTVDKVCVQFGDTVADVLAKVPPARPLHAMYRKL